MLATKIKLNTNVRGIHRSAQHLIKLFQVIYTNTPDFGYSNEKQKSWAKLYPGWSRQYPIVIYSGAVEIVGMAPLQMKGYDNIIPGRLTIGNDGYTVSISLTQDNKNRQCTTCTLPTISGGLLKNVYEFECLHFHWSKKNNRGCEHVIDNIRYPLEMHLVHRNIKYDCIEKALEHEDGLCVAAVFFDIAEMPYKPFYTIIDNFIYIQSTNTNITLDCGLVLNTLLPANIQNFYTYKGSSLSPPYNKSIHWIIFSQPIYISFDQLSAFQLLKKNQDDEIFDNCRNIQPIEDKKIYARDSNIPFVHACSDIPITTNNDMSCPHSHVPNATYNEMYFPMPHTDEHISNKKGLPNNSTSTNDKILDSTLTEKEAHNSNAAYNEKYFPISHQNENEANKKVNACSTATNKGTFDSNVIKDNDHSTETCNEMYLPIASKHEDESNKKIKTEPAAINPPLNKKHNLTSENYNEMYIPKVENEKIVSKQKTTNKQALVPTLTKKEALTSARTRNKKEYFNPIATNVLSSKTQDRGLMSIIRNMIKDALIKFFSK